MKLHKHSMKLISVMVRSVKLQIALQPLRWQYVLLQKDMAFMRPLCRSRKLK